MSAGVIQLKIPKRDSRVQVLQDQLDRGRRLVDARAKNMADVPGGETAATPMCSPARIDRTRASAPLADSELTRGIAEALKNHDGIFAAELDKQVDLEFGLKERGMGALHQHGKEHGC